MSRAVPYRIEGYLIQQIRSEPMGHVVLTDPRYYRPNGVAMANRDGLQTRLIRVLYRELVGPLSRHDYLHRKCTTWGCLNPHHFRKMNAAYPNPTHCQHGHEYTPENIRTGQYKCVTCYEALKAKRREAYRGRKIDVEG